tara:strand:- start:141 stop:860 length:720 start_codon:yes stop_codon:yes gene_type:complete
MFFKKLIVSFLLISFFSSCGATLRNSDVEKFEKIEITQETIVKSNTSTLPENIENIEVFQVQPPSSINEFISTEIPEGFCSALAVKSSNLLIEMEKQIFSSEKLDANTFYSLLLFSEELVSWVAVRVPYSVSNEILEFISLYKALSDEIKSLNLEMTSFSRIQAIIYSVLLDSELLDLESFVNAANYLGSYIETSCGFGYPLLTVFTNLVADEKAELVKDPQGFINDFFDLRSKEELKD